MTREYAIDRAEVMRRRAAEREAVGRDAARPFADRYVANVQADEFRELADRYDGLARSLAP